MNKAVICLLILLGFILNTNGQKLDQNYHRAEYAYEHYNYVDAIEYYKSSLEHNSDNDLSKLRLGECYRKLNDHSNAALWYGQVLDSNDSFDDIYKLHYAQSLMASNQNDKAEKWFNTYYASNKDHVLTNNRLSGIDDYDQFYERSDGFKIQKLEINSPSRDFSPAYFNNGLIFVSDRKESNGKNNWDHRVFLNLYYAQKDENGNFKAVEQLSKKLNSAYHEGPVSIYNNDNGIIFTRNNYLKKKLKRSTDGVNKLQLFFADIDKDGDWSNLRKFEHNSDEFSSGHPTINTTGELLIFSSDRPGGFGGSDLYSSRKEKGNWSEPVNLGAAINTEGDELFPYLQSDSLLYFSSNGHFGMGGLDIYTIPLNELKRDNLKNAGSPINSRSDDFGIIVSENGIDGYFSSNRESHENDDIYEFHSIPLRILIKVSDAKTGEYVKLNELKLRNSENEILSPKFSHDAYSLSAYYADDYVVEYDSSVFRYEKVEFSTEDIKPGTTKYVEVLLTRKDQLEEEEVASNTNPEKVVPNEPSLKVEPIYYDNDKTYISERSRKILSKVKAYMDQFNELKIVLKSYTDSNASDDYNMKLSNARSKAVRDHLISLGIEPNRIQTSAYGETSLTNDCGNGVDCSDQEHRLNRRTELEFIH